MPEEPSLVDFQDALLELLTDGLSRDDIFAALKTDPRFQPFKDYVGQFDPDMVEVACDLMGKWAKRR
jgi:hypothetical protein